MNSRVSSLSCVQVQLYWLLEHCDYSVVKAREQEENNKMLYQGMQVYNFGICS